MTPAIRYFLTQLETAIDCRDWTLTEHYADLLRRELDPARETVATQRHECEPNRNGDWR
jgi:hypothetical protein